MKRIHKTFGLTAIALLASLVGLATAQQGENSAPITFEGPALREPVTLQNQTTVPIQQDTLIEQPEPGSIRFQSENPFDTAPGQIDETQQRNAPPSTPAATIPPTLNPPQSATQTDPVLPSSELTVPLIENDGAEQVPGCAGGICPYQREPVLRAPYPLPPTGYVPYGGFGIDCDFDCYRASHYHYDRRSRYDYDRWFHGLPPLPFQTCPYGVCPGGFDY